MVWCAQHKVFYGTNILYCIFTLHYVYSFDEKPNKKLINNLDTGDKKESKLHEGGDYFGSSRVFWGLIVADIRIFGISW